VGRARRCHGQKRECLTRLHGRLIGWCDYSSNPIRPEGGGWQCQKTSAGCAHCYAPATHWPAQGKDWALWPEALRVREFPARKVALPVDNYRALR